MSKNKRRGPKIPKDIIPEKFEDHFKNITVIHRFGLKQIHLEYVNACQVAFEECSKKEYKTDLPKKKAIQIQKSIQRHTSLRKRRKTSITPPSSRRSGKQEDAG